MLTAMSKVRSKRFKIWKNYVGIPPLTDELCLLHSTFIVVNSNLGGCEAPQLRRTIRGYHRSVAVAPQSLSSVALLFAIHSGHPREGQYHAEADYPVAGERRGRQGRRFAGVCLHKLQRPVPGEPTQANEQRRCSNVFFCDPTERQLSVSGKSHPEIVAVIALA